MLSYQQRCDGETRGGRKTARTVQEINCSQPALLSLLWSAENKCVIFWIEFVNYMWKTCVNGLIMQAWIGGSLK